MSDKEKNLQSENVETQPQKSESKFQQALRGFWKRASETLSQKFEDWKKDSGFWETFWKKASDEESWETEEIAEVEEKPENNETRNSQLKLISKNPIRSEFDYWSSQPDIWYEYEIIFWDKNYKIIDRNDQLWKIELIFNWTKFSIRKEENDIQVTYNQWEIKYHRFYKNTKFFIDENGLHVAQKPKSWFFKPKQQDNFVWFSYQELENIMK